MADISAFQSGDFNNSGKVNWRGDQVNIPNAQSIYKTSSVQLADLGMRLVVGDRVFRYAKAGGTLAAGQWCENQGSFEIAMGGTFASLSTNVLAATVGQKTVSVVASTTWAANIFAEGNLIVASGTAANTGQTFRIKSHALTTSGGTCTFQLYDEINRQIATADSYSIIANAFGNVFSGTTGATTVCVGISPVIATTGDYFWIQTWGPSSVKNAAAVKGAYVVADVTGQVIQAVSGTTAGACAQIIGVPLLTMTASQYGPVYVTIQP